MLKHQRYHHLSEQMGQDTIESRKNVSLFYTNQRQLIKAIMYQASIRLWFCCRKSAILLDGILQEADHVPLIIPPSEQV